MSRIIYISKTMGQGGAENVVENLAIYATNHYDEVIVISNGGYRVDNLESNGIKHIEIPNLDEKSIVNFIKTIIVIYNTLNKESDIIHTHHRMAAFYVKICRYFKRFRHIYTAHNVFENKKKLTHFSIKNSEIVAVGNSVKKNLISYFNIDSSRIEVINNTSFFEFQTKNIIDELYKYHLKGKFIYTNIGRLTEQKNMLLFCKAIKIINKYNNNIEAFIIGDGEEKKVLEKYIKENKITNVHILGFKKDVENYIYSSDVICLSSKWEGQPLIPIEAISMGKPLVVTPVEGTLEIVKENETGFVSKSIETEKEYADALLDSYNKREKWKQISINAHNKYNKLYSNKVFFEKYDSIYKGD